MKFVNEKQRKAMFAKLFVKRYGHGEIKPRIILDDDLRGGYAYLPVANDDVGDMYEFGTIGRPGKPERLYGFKPISSIAKHVNPSEYSQAERIVRDGLGIEVDGGIKSDLIDRILRSQLISKRRVTKLPDADTVVIPW